MDECQLPTHIFAGDLQNVRGTCPVSAKVLLQVGLQPILMGCNSALKKGRGNEWVAILWPCCDQQSQPSLLHFQVGDHTKTSICCSR